MVLRPKIHLQAALVGYSAKCRPTGFTFRVIFHCHLDSNKDTFFAVVNDKNVTEIYGVQVAVW